MASQSKREKKAGFDSHQDRSEVDWLDSEPAIAEVEAGGAGRKATEPCGPRGQDEVEKAELGSGAGVLDGKTPMDAGNGDEWAADNARVEE